MKLRWLPSNRAHLLRNVTCVYCGCDLEATAATKEHVVGRRFVPKGTLNQQWNLIVRACAPCNVQKSDLEDDISAITLACPTTATGVGRNAVLAAEAYRKASGSISRITRQPVLNSPHKGKITVPLGANATFSATFVGPPQMAMVRAFELARLQLSGFFYLVTFDPDAKRGGFWTGQFMPLLIAPESDWGNTHFRAFMDGVASWEHRFLGVTANEHFKIVIRRNAETPTWAWALEWNLNFRLAGFFGDPTSARQLVAMFPALDVHTVPLLPAGHFAMRLEQRLSPEDDSLFACPDNQGQV